MWSVNRWRLATHAGVILAIILVVIEARANGPKASGLEFIWTVVGAVGMVYGLSVLSYRVLQERWRRILKINGRVRDSIRTELVMSASRALIQVLIVIAGVAAMKTPAPIREATEDAAELVALCIIGVGVICTFKTWYAERRTVRLPKPPEDPA